MTIRYDEADKDIILPIGTTLDRFIMYRQTDFPFASGELSQLLRDIALAAKIVNREINRAGLSDIQGGFGQTNVQNEEQQKLDVVANIRFLRALKKGGEVFAIISEENDHVIETGNKHGKYVVAIDPLDGSSNIDVNVSIGTIFSIYRRTNFETSEALEADLLKKGTEQVVAGYVLYGSSTMLVYTSGQGVNGFTYEPSLGEFYLSHPNITIPNKAKTYSVNDGYYYDFDKVTQEFIEHCRRQRFRGRYIGSLVSDFHRNLLSGGIYFYPGTKKSPNGKLRLIYECMPLAFIIEQAGGMATDGRNRIMDIQPESLHQRTPYFVGSPDMVQWVQDRYELIEGELNGLNGHAHLEVTKTA